MKSLVLSLLLICCIWADPHDHHTHHSKVSIDKVLLKTEPKNFQLAKDGETIFPKEELKEVLSRLQSAAEVDQHLVNNLTDRAFKHISTYLLHHDYDPLELPEEHADFHYWLIITYFGGIDLTRGRLEDLSTLFRESDAKVLSVNTTSSIYKVSIPVEFDDLQARYNYRAEIMGLGPSGGIEAYIKNVHVELVVSFNAAENRVDLLDFRITNSGHIDVAFTGNALIDWLLDLLLDTVTTLVKERLLYTLEHVVGIALREALEEINGLITKR